VRSRLWAGAALVWLPVAVTVGTWSAWSGELPERIATHWGGSGAADRYSSAGGFWTVMLVLGVIAGLVAAGAAAAATKAEPDADAGTGPGSAPRAGSGSTSGAGPGSAADGTRAGAGFASRITTARFLLIAAGSAAGGTAGIWVASATATLAAPGDARLGWRFGYFLAGMAWGVVIRLAAGPVRLPPRDDRPLVDPLALAPTERAAYSTTLSSPLFTGILAAAAVIAAVTAVATAMMLDSTMLLLAVVPVGVALLFGRVRVTADRRGLRLVSGLLGVTMKRIPLDAIDSARAEEIVPLQWGGWGYRIMPGRSALVLRGGPGLVLTLTDGRRFAVTVDRPEEPAALLLALRARAAG
jgi:hypothetical protein